MGGPMELLSRLFTYLEAKNISLTTYFKNPEVADYRMEGWRLKFIPDPACPLDMIYCQFFHPDCSHCYRLNVLLSSVPRYEDWETDISVSCILEQVLQNNEN